MITAIMHHAGVSSKTAEMTGFTSFADACRVLLYEGWSRVTLMAHNVCILVDDDGRRLILQNKDMVCCPECGQAVHDFTSEAECIGWLGNCAGCEISRAN